MSRALRFVAIVAASALVIAGAVVGLGGGGNGAAAPHRHRRRHAAAPARQRERPRGLDGLRRRRQDRAGRPARLPGSQAGRPHPGVQGPHHRGARHRGPPLLPARRLRHPLDHPGPGHRLLGESGLQGGSTIAQQLVKQTYLSSARKLSRKVKEAVLADRLERKYTKDQILQAYLNTIYLGNGAYGVEAAANVYFGEHASSAQPAPGGPSGRADPEPERLRPHPRPRRRPHPTVARSCPGWCTTATSPPPRRRPPTGCRCPRPIIEPAVAGDQISDYYVQEVQTELLAPGSPLGSTYDQRYQALFEGGLKIYTNLNPDHAGDRRADHRRRHAGQQPGLPAGHGHHRPGHRQGAGHGGRRRAARAPTTTSSPRAPGSPVRASSSSPCWPPCSRVTRSTTPWTAQSPCAIDFPTDHDLLTDAGQQRRRQRRRGRHACSTPPPSRSTAPTSAWPTRWACPTSSAWPSSLGITARPARVPLHRHRLHRRAPHRDGGGLRRRGRRRRVPRPVVHRPHRRPVRRDHLQRAPTPATR